MAYLCIEDIEITNANAMNGVMVGLPAITAFMGAVHALQRKLASWNVSFDGAAIGIKEYEMREVSKGRMHFLNISLPSETTEKYGKKTDARIFPQAYIDLKLHLIIEGNFDELVKSRKFLNDVKNKLHTMRVAGGNIGKFKVRWIKDDCPPPYGFYLKDCTGEMMAYDGDNVLEKMIHALEDKQHRYVVLANGFRALNEPGYVENQRDPDTLHVFAEQVYTCGKYVRSDYILNIDDFIFRYIHDGVSYLCTQKYPAC